MRKAPSGFHVVACPFCDAWLFSFAGQPLLVRVQIVCRCRRVLETDGHNVNEVVEAVRVPA